MKSIWVRRKSFAGKDSVRSFTRVFSYLRPGELLFDSSPDLPWILRSENVVLYVLASRKRDNDTELRIRLRFVVG